MARNKKYSIAVCVIYSLLGHLLAMYALVISGPFNFSTPVQPQANLYVTFKAATEKPPLQTEKAYPVTATTGRQRAPRIRNNGIKGKKPTLVFKSAIRSDPPQEQGISHAAARVSSLSPTGQDLADTVEGIKKNITGNHNPVAVDYDQNKGPVRDAGEFLATKNEKLTYRISLLTIPVGTAVMEATNNNGELRITIRITSNAFFSKVYPVDDLVETRMIKGNYLLTRVRQSEGNYRGDFGFTLMLREHKAFWVDRLANRYNYQPLPGDDVMDAVSGFYFLRNQDLEVGKSVELHLFDSNEYSPTTIEVLRRERVSLPGGSEVDTLVLHPLFKTAGFFRRTGDIMIWLTADKFRVPVRLETFISMGKVTAELIAAESEPGENVTEKNLPVNLPEKSNH